ncbi:thiopeptide-type bacteriocin biosynthesis protein [Actinocorallia sp. API 0066]|uniref:thiopeptide-type bacteriocin biosynthesis protein n=1 Tax=Actinocorallia sp. API 0066 TaxID=2896846 RepID=UPI001E4BE5C1|nr:thiopeptide-type bacteriocin biosynthesis protein [Actinocorallia sp. API 0066]MCD0447655.1 thiopeptide-type bacteriocin biosynthesis protein [Actinocorallia sp. API 0066]
MDETRWKQVNITYPGQTPREREHAAVQHLSTVLPAAESTGTITSWWFIRKGRWRIRYLGPPHPPQDIFTNKHAWTPDIYEPETHAFGGPHSMTAAHTLFHHDSHHLLTYLADNPNDRQERSLILCTALMRAAGLDLNEQGDVWAKIAEQRAPLTPEPPTPNVWASYTHNVRHLLLGHPHPDLTDNAWLTSFQHTGTTLQQLRETGHLTRGIRAVISQHIIFHWNRLGLPATTQAALAQAATQATLKPPTDNTTRTSTSSWP